MNLSKTAFRSTRTLFAIGATALLALTAGGPARAQATIDQNKALAGSLSPGDLPGFPITLSVPGSYKLTSNLVVPAGLNGIEITSDNVTLDLNGFRIAGSGSCTRDQVSYVVNCNAQSKYGIVVLAGGVTGTVRNGSVQGFITGVLLEGGTAESLTIRQNINGLFFNGFFAAGRATGVLAEMNHIGIHMQWGMIERSVATANNIGFTGSNTVNVSVVESQASYNVTGIKEIATRANRVSQNKVDLSGNAAF
jgi:hypothetical protein